MSYEIKRILCCVGLRGDYDRVVCHAAALALSTGAELHILHAVKPISNDMINTLKVNIRDQDTLKSMLEQRLIQARDDLKKRLDDFWVRYPDLKKSLNNINIDCSVLEGYPASVIAHFASQKKFDMIVMSSNKRSFPATYAGKVTKGVIKRAKVPVVVVSRNY